MAIWYLATILLIMPERIRSVYSNGPIIVHRILGTSVPSHDQQNKRIPFSAVPENSLMAFNLFVSLNLKYLELDVHLSKDRQVVVVHDHDLRYTVVQNPSPSEPFNVEDHMYDDFKDLPLRASYYEFMVSNGFDSDNTTRENYRFYQNAHDSQHIPLLEQLLRLYPDKTIKFNVELKGDNPELFEKVLGLSELYPGRIDIVSSFNFSFFESNGEMEEHGQHEGGGEKKQYPFKIGLLYDKPQKYTDAKRFIEDAEKYGASLLIFDASQIKEMGEILDNLVQQNITLYLYTSELYEEEADWAMFVKYAKGFITNSLPRDVKVYIENTKK